MPGVGFMAMAEFLGPSYRGGCSLDVGTFHCLSMSAIAPRLGGERRRRKRDRGDIEGHSRLFLPDTPSPVQDESVTGDPSPCIDGEQSYGASNRLLSLSVRSAGSYQPCVAYWLVCR